MRTRLAAAKLTKEVAERELEGLQARASDAPALLRERSNEIEGLEALGDAGRKEAQALEGRLRKEEALHRESRRGWRQAFAPRRRRRFASRSKGRGPTVESLEAINQAGQE